jgi:haloalkane dehalogenase
MKSRPFAVDAAAYPFEDRWFTRNGSSMHYVDEGQGMAVVMCHGNPTWSYLYRNIIKALSPHCRCIAYDLPGFGFSDHPPGYSYKPQEHAEWVEALLFEHLKLERFVIVVQDWGGPIGLSIATRYPEKVAGVVISSTWAWAPSKIGRIFSGLMGSRLGQYLILQRNFFATTLVAMMMGKSVTNADLKAYADPFPTPASRLGPAIFPVQIVAATPWLVEIEQRLGSLAGKPVEFVFGLKDLGTRPADMAMWLKHFPNAGVQRFPSANHFTQEDCPDAYVTAVKRILAVAG